MGAQRPCDHPRSSRVAGRDITPRRPFRSGPVGLLEDQPRLRRLHALEALQPFEPDMAQCAVVRCAHQDENVEIAAQQREVLDEGQCPELGGDSPPRVLPDREGDERGRAESRTWSAKSGW